MGPAHLGKVLQEKSDWSAVSSLRESQVHNVAASRLIPGQLHPPTANTHHDHPALQNPTKAQLCSPFVSDPVSPRFILPIIGYVGTVGGTDGSGGIRSGRMASLGGSDGYIHLLVSCDDC